jgi:hypothetical protein
MTACATDAFQASGFGQACLRSCTVASNGAECEGGTTCVLRAPSDASDTRMVCRPLE